MNTTNFMYETPQVELIEVVVEQGFATSQIPDTGNENYNSNGW